MPKYRLTVDDNKSMITCKLGEIGRLKNSIHIYNDDLDDVYKVIQSMKVYIEDIELLINDIKEIK